MLIQKGHLKEWWSRKKYKQCSPKEIISRKLFFARLKCFKMIFLKADNVFDRLSWEVQIDTVIFKLAVFVNDTAVLKWIDEME